MTGLRVQRLEKQLGGNRVVADVSFAVAEGEFFVLLGPSGEGKSTILRMICELETPAGGTITTNRCRTWTRNCGTRRGTASWTSTTASGNRVSTSRTTRGRRWRWPIGSG
ncbi:MAG TPA: ATP-binding cassette domain-containing protein [Thermomicrobiales bacterium]